MKTFYLEEYLNTINGLPDDLKKNFDKMLKLEQKNNDLTNDVVLLITADRGVSLENAPEDRSGAHGQTTYVV